MNKRILVIDDDIDDQMIIEAAIKLVDPLHECAFASNGREAIEYAERTMPYDIVLIDLNMPVMNGFDTLKTIKTLSSYDYTPLVVISTSNNSLDIEKASQLGADRYIVKPDSFSELIEKLKQVLNDKILP